jgi:hypothetical protein
MHVQLLHLDDAFHHQQEFLRVCEAEGASQTDLRQEASPVRLWGKDRDLQTLSRALPPVNGTRLTFMGSGDFHHVTALIAGQLAASRDKPFTVVQFDNHPDWVHFKGGLHCGSWINRALQQPNVQKIVNIGVTSGDLNWPELRGGNLRQLAEGRLELFPYTHAPSRVLGQYGEGQSFKQKGRALHWRCAGGMSDAELLPRLLTCIATPDIYITVDKDVLAEDDAAANWEQGQMPLQRLLAIIRQLGGARRVIGADVVGDFGTPHYPGSAWTRLLKRGELWIDRARRPFDVVSAAERNAASNLQLLAVFKEVMG